MKSESEGAEQRAIIATAGWYLSLLQDSPILGRGDVDSLGACKQITEELGNIYIYLLLLKDYKSTERGALPGTSSFPTVILFSFS